MIFTTNFFKDFGQEVQLCDVKQIKYQSQDCVTGKLGFRYPPICPENVIYSCGLLCQS